MSPSADQQLFDWQPPQLTPTAGLAEPRLWVRRLLLWHDMNDAPVHEIPFRRGLNIISSPPGPGTHDAPTGHAAGKTLLCRALRFCLGEETFADPEDTAAIRSRFKNGGIGAEIRLNGEWWVVRRAFSTNADNRAAKSEQFDDLAGEVSREAFNSFRAELDAVALDEAQTQLLKDFEDIDAPWQYVLAWLTRDQECRLDGLMHWRHPDSSSHSPVRKSAADTRLNLLRVILRLYSAESNTVRKNVADSSEALSRAEADIRRHAERFEILKDDVSKVLALDESGVWPPDQQFFEDEQSAHEAHFHRLQAVADERIRALRPIEVSNEQRADEDDFQRVRTELATIDSLINAAKDEVRIAGERRNLLTSTSAEAGTALRRAKHPTCPYDDTPLDVDAAQFVCPLPKLPDSAAAQQLADDTETEKQRTVQELADRQGRLAALMGELASLKAQEEKLGRRIAAHQLAIAGASASSQAAWAAKDMVRRFAEAVRRLEEAQAREKKAKDTQRIIDEQRKAHLESHSTAKLTSWFDFLVKRVVAPEATGEVTLDGHGLQPTIHWRGRRRSVALNSLRLVLFDIAAMLCAVEGASSAPAFLLHDSPREGDLDPWTYARLFQTAFDLGPDDASAPFQYIVTTTTEPPTGEIQNRVRLQLSAGSKGTRFFKEDL